MAERDWLAERFEEHRRHLRACLPHARLVERSRRRAGRALFYAELGLSVQLARVNGAAGAFSTKDGELFSVGSAIVRGGKIVELDFLADPERLRELGL